MRYYTEEEFLAVDAQGVGLVELCDGQIEYLPSPNVRHQRILVYLLEKLDACVSAARSGEVLFAPLPVRLGPSKYRTPDLMFFRPERITDPDRQPDGADLVIEVVGEGEESRKHDYETKRKDYAQAGIAEYWIVDPETETITVLVLVGTAYNVHGEFQLGTIATSVLLRSFSGPVIDVFAAGQ